MSTTSKKVFIKPEEYLVRERLAEFKSEYYDGQIYSMAGTSYRHTVILMNLSGELYTRLKGGPCRPSSTDLRLSIENGKAYTYPDIMVICGGPQFADQNFDTVLNPALIIEILSPSTESWDRGGKFERYRAIESLQEYVMVWQDRRLVERHARRAGEWIATRWDGEEDVLSLESIGCNVPLFDVYRDVTFDEAD
jgi:Uma2 family endonuclease